MAVGIDARGGFQAAGLKDLVGLVIAVAGVDGADDGKLVHHGCLPGQMFADGDARHARGDRREGPAVLDRPIGFHVPHVDVAGPAGHPQQDDALAPGWLTVSRRLGPLLEQTRQRHPGQPRQARLEHVAPADESQAFPGQGIEIAECVLVSVGA